MTVLHLNKDNFKDTIVNSNKPVLVDFWASWCGPCRMLAPVLDEVASEVGDDAIIAKVNVDDERELADMFNIVSIPTMIVFKDGQIIDRVSGYMTKDNIVKRIYSHI